jgi:hypothetical protein
MNSQLRTLLILILGILTIICCSAWGHEARTLPFLLERGRVMVPASINGSPPLKITLDSGMGWDGVVLYHESALNLIDTIGIIDVLIPGAGAGEPSKGKMIETGRIKFGDVEMTGQRVIVSQGEYTQSFRGDGVFGWNLFGHFIVEIDYDQLLITLHDTTEVTTDPAWECLPVELNVQNIPFFDVTLEVVAGEVVSMRGYIDLASREAVELLARPDQKFKLPEHLEPSYLGTGLSGDIYGHRGRSARVKICSYELFDVATAFAPADVRSKPKGADVIFGNGFISRFNIIFDYPHSCLWIRPSKAFADPFE